MKLKELLLEEKLVFYHGSTSSIKEFNLDNISSADSIDQEGPGIYLTNSAIDARKYGQYIHELQVNIVKSKIMPDKRQINSDFIRGLISKSPDKEMALSNYGEDIRLALSAAVESIMDSYGPNDYRKALEQIWFDFYKGYENKWLSRMRSVGWDGFLVKTNDYQHFICFKPEIIKIIKVTKD